MQRSMLSTMRDDRAGTDTSRDVNVYALLARIARDASRGSLAATAAIAGGVALAAVLLGAAHWTLLTACYLVWSYAVWGLVFAPPHPPTRRWRTAEYLVVASDTALAAILLVGLFYLALGARWML